ncbi:ABC transporter ATP-binding protein [Lactobacillus sp. ESL0731]|uniref:ABC transporter ATP-binding protein n=1 Tax=unclassified Lactobacillus TaxID=2620435 RepID=UPI0023F77D70|nr:MULTISPECIES: ABC transporter ATP-binding protein [unclassified Lactobacillus]WEV50608.1 ABC transporter ATP-binding protein [Lactobacillus sp. ESL0700]WEV61738.1 ABC transporter ATP-binding protein [Lactobacillus sp. ESL0731]
MTTTIKINNLKQGYGKTTVLTDINLQINSGEILAIIGPSGSGKTTLINSIMGTLKPQQGSVEVLKTLMPNRKVLGKIGFMAQSDALYENLTAYENLAFFASMQGLSKKEFSKQIDYVVGIVKLAGDLDKRVVNYSGGMKRRLSLAIALISNPQILILDEPTIGIDPELRRQIWQELHRLAQKGKTIILTTHVMADAEEADQLLMIRDGKVIAKGRPKELVDSYQVKNIEEVFLKAGQKEDENQSIN